MTQETGDPIWNTAWDWVQREHDSESFDEAARAEMTAWLLSEPAHRRAYDKAARLWLLAGFVPPTNDFGDDLPDDDAEPRAGK